MRALLVAAFLALAAAAPAATEAAIRVGSEATVAVSVATLWKAPDIARPLDAPALATPADPRAWSRNLATTDLRVWLDSHVQTQALYGERVAVLERRGRWARIAVLDQPDPQDPHGYPGWVPVAQLASESASPAAATVVVTARTAWLRTPAGRPVVELSYATRLPLVRRAGDDLVVRSADGRAALLTARKVQIEHRTLRPTGARIVAEARRFLGVHYLWGGLSAWGYDCSGIVWATYRRFGVTIPRDADPQFRAGRPVAPNALRPGDLLFYGTQSYVHHVAIYAGGGRMLEAPDSAHRVRIVPVRWRGFAGARRF
ncbi:MAG TPA: C40 family peptidase [Gaiellaceae bacterium]